jgi:putative addiction module antidote
MVSLKITQIGNSLGVILPKEVLAELRANKGDTLTLVEVPGGFRVAAVSDPHFDAQMAAAQKIMRKRRSALRALAK